MSLSAQARERDVRGAGVVTAALLSALLFSAGVKLPLLLPLSTLAPLPLALHRLMRGAFSGLSSAVLAGLLVASAFSGEWALRYAFYIAIPALLLGGQMTGAADVEGLAVVHFDAGGERVSGRLRERVSAIAGLGAEAIATTEDRERFAELLDRLGLEGPRGQLALDAAGLHAAIAALGLPIIVRPSWVIGGRGIAVLRSAGRRPRCSSRL